MIRKNIEKRVLPFLEDEEKIKESYGALIALLRWMDSYEALMVKAGISLEESAYVFLRSVGFVRKFDSHCLKESQIVYASFLGPREKAPE